MGDGAREPPLVATWRQSAQYGYAASMDSASMIAAPLLAGFSLTLLVQVIDKGKDAFWSPDLALVLLTIAILALLAAVQCGFWARQYFVTPAELHDWWPDLARPERWAQVRAEQWAQDRVHRIWAARFRFTYRIGILALLGAVVVALVPPKGLEPLRAVAIGLAALGFAGELGWIAAGWLRASPQRRSEREAVQQNEIAIREANAALEELERRIAAGGEPELERKLRRAQERLARLRIVWLEDESVQAGKAKEAAAVRASVEGLPRPVRGAARLALRAAAWAIPASHSIGPLMPADPPDAQREQAAGIKPARRRVDGRARLKS